MALEEGEVGLTDAEKIKQDTDEKIRASEEKLRAAEIARARAEGEAEALRRAPITEAKPNAVTEDQWLAMEAETGKTRTQIQADAKLMSAIAEERMAPVRKQASEAEQRAKKAEERAARAEGKHSLSRVEENFYHSNPGFSAHRGDIEAYIAKFPDEMREDPKKYAELLADAKFYVRGKAREDFGSRRRGGERQDREIGKDRPEALEDSNESDAEGIDLSDLDNDGARRLVTSLHQNLGKLSNRSEKRSKETVEQWKKDTTRDGRGVAIDSQEEFARGNELLDGDMPLGGSRGAR